ncbi:LuxR C-terminal-related transcriptional regulator, partial [Salmonella enterica]|uniref:LuxR C-terminal-related transcriptional regulator n=1 Tax=Salmonella enterica TaxID=28901 RepID=UPI003B3A9C55
QIMLMITKGQKVNEISEQLNLSPKTVNSYRYRMFSKLNIHGEALLQIVGGDKLIIPFC